LISMLYGFLWGETIFAVTGIFGALTIGLAFLGSRVRSN
jgi:hypothetical protein